MKYLKWAAALLVVLAVVAVIAWLRRDSIARDIANSVLGGQDIVVKALSVDSLETDRIRFGTIVLEHGNGTRFDIEGLSFPLSFPSVRPERLSADRVVVTPPEGSGEPTPWTDVLQTVLGLPASLPGTEVAVAYLSIADIADATGILWATEGADQRLLLDIAGARIVASIDHVTDAEHRAAISAAVAGVDDAAALGITLTKGGDGFAIGGVVSIDAAPWLPLLQQLEVLPGGFTGIEAELSGPVEIALDHEGPGRIVGTAQLSLAGPSAASYRTAGDADILLRVASADPVAVTVEYPSLEWSAGVATLDGSAGLAGAGDLQIGLTNLECRSGIRCGMDSVLRAGSIVTPQFSAAALELTASLVIDVSTPSIIGLSPAATLTIDGIASPALSLASLSVSDFDGATLSIGESDWSASADHLGLTLSELSIGTIAVASLPVTLDSLIVADGGGAIDVRLSVPARAAYLSFGDLQFHVPGIEGGARRDGNALGAALLLSGSSDALSANVDLEYDLSTGKGSAAARDAQLVFDRAKLSTRLVKWPYPFDVVAGTWRADLDIDWESGDDATRYRGTMSHRVEGLAGNYNDIAFVGVNTVLGMELDPEAGLSIAPSTVAVELIDVGMPLAQVSASLAPDVEGRSVQVDSLSGAALGGRFTTDPFRYSATADTNDLMLRLESIQLQFMVDILEFEDLDMSGSLSGVLPVTISEGKVTIRGGRLENDPPGGVIHYRVGDAGAGVPDAGLGIASRALGNFEFDSLTSDVNYSASGDLGLKMRLSGINPDMDPTQPIILNLGVENNIPQLLRSLQAIRSIEDIIQRKSGQ